MAGGPGSSNGVRGSAPARPTTLNGFLTIPSGATQLQINVGGFGGAPDAQTGGQGGWNGGAPGGNGPNATTEGGAGGGGAGGGADEFSFRSGTGGGGGGGLSYVNPTFVTGVSESSLSNEGFVRITYVTVTQSDPGTLRVGESGSWFYTSDLAGTTYAVTGGALPPGMTLGSDTGNVTGIPSAAGTYNVTVTGTRLISGTNGISSSVAATITVQPGSGAQLHAGTPTAIGTTTATIAPLAVSTATA